MIENLGIQLYTLRNEMTDEESVRAGFKKIKEIGYNHIQPASMCNLAAEKFASLAKEAGLTCEKCGTISSWSQILNDPDALLATHKAIGATNIGIGYMPPEWRDCPESITKFIAKANEFAVYAAERGFTVGYHNHSFEFRKVGGERIMDRLVNELDERINFILDTYWVQHGGGDHAEWIKKLSGRIDVLHLKDMEILVDVTDPKKGTVTTPSIAEIGAGNINFEDIIPLAEKCGVKYFVTEDDRCVSGRSLENAKRSADYIKANLIK